MVVSRLFMLLGLRAGVQCLVAGHDGFLAKIRDDAASAVIIFLDFSLAVSLWFLSLAASAPVSRFPVVADDRARIPGLVSQDCVSVRVPIV